MEFITTHAKDIFAAIGAAVTFASTIVVLTPTDKDDKILATIIGFLSRFSVFNVKTK